MEKAAGDCEGGGSCGDLQDFTGGRGGSGEGEDGGGGRVLGGPELDLLKTARD